MVVGLLILAQGLSASNHTIRSRSCRMYSCPRWADLDWDDQSPDRRVLENWITCHVGLVKSDYGQAPFGALTCKRWVAKCLSALSLEMARRLAIRRVRPGQS